MKCQNCYFFLFDKKYNKKVCNNSLIDILEIEYAKNKDYCWLYEPIINEKE